MKNKIAARLIRYFTIPLLLFALTVGGVFIWSFSRYSTELHQQDMEDRAARIAGTMAKYIGEEESGGALQESDGNGKNAQNGMAGYGKYLSLLGDIAMGDVWLIDKQQNLITRGENHEPVSEKELPESAEEIIRKVLQGETAFSESFSGFLSEASLTVGVPITSSTGKVLGAVLLHSPIHGLEEARNQQMLVIVVSILAALLITVPLTVLLSMRFTKPLTKMKAVSARLADGDYHAKTQIDQKDEIGELAGSIDILSEHLNAAREQQRKTEQMRQIFFSNISHELRTPVTVMRGSLEALCDGVVHEPEKVREYHKQMLQESIHLQRLVNDLLELSRLQNTDFKMDMAQVNLSDVLRDVARSMRRMAEQKNITLRMLDLPASVPFFGDYSRLRQMFIAVIDNAVKFSPPEAEVIVRCEWKAGSRAIAVTDHGPGIAKKDREHIFDRFHKAHTDENPQGTGLGLAIAKAIAERHQVTLEAESVPGNTVFRFVLPPE